MTETQRFIKIGPEADFAEGQVKVVEARGKRLAICKSDGKFYAIDDKCTHDGGPLGEGSVVDGQVECPRHGAKFDVKTGKPTCLPAVKAVSTYQVDVRYGEVWLAMPGDS